MRKYLPRAWEHNRFWQKERETGSRQEPTEDDGVDYTDLPEDLRMPRTRGETNRFRLSLKKTIVQSHRRRGIPAHLVMARLRRRLNITSGGLA